MPEKPKGRRVSIDLTAPAAAEVDRLTGITGLTTADLFRQALSLLRIYLSAQQKGLQLVVVDPQQPAHRSQIELPIFLGSAPPETAPATE